MIWNIDIPLADWALLTAKSVKDETTETAMLSEAEKDELCMHLGVAA